MKRLHLKNTLGRALAWFPSRKAEVKCLAFIPCFTLPLDNECYFCRLNLCFNLENLRYRIEDLGCCKVICHKDFGRNVFVGTIFTDVHVSMGIIDDLFCELKLNWHNLDLNLTEASHQEEAKKS